MYCTVKFQIYTYNDVFKYLQDVGGQWFDPSIGESSLRYGKLGSLRVKRGRSYNYSIEGSLANFYFGNNFETLSIGQTEEVIIKISDLLHQDINEADVSVVHFASNIITNEPPVNYFCHLIESSRMNRNIRNTSLYFSNSQRQLVFYDKSRDYKDKMKTIPDIYDNKYVFRYEMRFNNLKKTKITGRDLYNPLYFINFLKQWKNSYERIKKCRFPSLVDIGDFDINKTTLGYYRWRLLIEKMGGVENAFTVLDNEHRKKTITRQFKYDVKAKINETVNFPLLIVDKDLIAELDQKIDDIYNNFLV